MKSNLYLETNIIEGDINWEIFEELENVFWKKEV
jgi:hypothetical protein